MSATLSFIRSATGRLATSYLIVIMGMSLGYSLVLYNISVQQLQRQLPPRNLYRQLIDDQAFLTRDQVNEFLEDRIDEGRRALIQRLLFLNLVMLLLGSGLSYYLARRTLQPIEASVESQSQFVSDASHELRTPLTTIYTSNEVALRNRSLTLSQAKRLLQENIQEVAKLQSLTDNLLALAKSDAAPSNMQRESIQDIVLDALNRVVALAQSKGISIDERVKVTYVYGSRPELTETIVILLENAIKYSPDNSTVRIDGGTKSKRGYISVTDQGPGIRPYDLRRIFDRFYRADQSRSAQHVQGHGIGLSLAQKLVAQQGGEIKVQSAVGKGSTFTILVPLDPEQVSHNDVKNR